MGHRSLAVGLGLLSIAACDPAPQPKATTSTSPSTRATPSATTPGTATPGTATPGTATPGTATPGTASCTPHFTPHQPGADGCSANHTLCSDGPDGPECHGGAILIPCGESGERCGKTFFCDCGDAGAR